MTLYGPDGEEIETREIGAKRLQRLESAAASALTELSQIITVYVPEDHRDRVKEAVSTLLHAMTAHQKEAKRLHDKFFTCEPK